MIIKFLAQNIKRGGHLNDNNQPEERWQKIVERVKSEKPDFLLLCEAVGWDKDGHADVARAMHDFGLSALPLAPSSNGYPTLLMYNPETVGQWKHWNTGFADQTVHGFGVAAFDLGLPDLLTVIPAHVGPFTHEQVMSDTAMIANRGYRYGQLVVLGGDFNTFPLEDSPGEALIAKPKDLQFRYDLATGEPNRLPAQKMRQAGYTDVADHLYHVTNNNEYLRQTTEESGRIDRFYVSEPLRDAIVEYHRLFDPTVSDHAGIVMTLDTSKVTLG